MRLTLIILVLLFACFEHWSARAATLIIDGPIAVGCSSLSSSSLAAYWKLDESSDGSSPVTRVDSGGNGQDLDDTNNVASDTGKIGNAATFVAASSERLSHADSATLSTGDINFTLSCWVKSTGYPAFSTFISKDNASDQREFDLGFQQTPGNAFIFRVWTNNGAGSVSVQAVTPVVDTWYHIIAWQDADNNQIGIRVNDSTQATTTQSGTITDSTADFYLGVRGGTFDRYTGLIDEVAFFKRLLTPAEKTCLYNSGAGRTCCPFSN